MRESRTSGSERGKSRKGLTYLPNFFSYRIKKDAPLWMRTRAKRKLLPDGNRARREWCA